MSDKKKLITAIAVGCVCSILFSVILTAIFAAVMLSTGLLPGDLTEYLSAAVLGLGALVGGFIAAKINKGAGIPVGGLTGLFLICFTVMASCAKGSSGVGSLLVIKLLASVLMGILGGILGLKEKNSTKYGRF